jgi:hypothetical protein
MDGKNGNPQPMGNPTRANQTPRLPLQEKPGEAGLAQEKYPLLVRPLHPPVFAHPLHPQGVV